MRNPLTGLDVSKVMIDNAIAIKPSDVLLRGVSLMTDGVMGGGCLHFMSQSDKFKLGILSPLLPISNVTTNIIFPQHQRTQVVVTIILTPRQLYSIDSSIINRSSEHTLSYHGLYNAR
jgi:hypothetical protein